MSRYCDYLHLEKGRQEAQAVRSRGGSDPGFCSWWWAVLEQGDLEALPVPALPLSIALPNSLLPFPSPKLLASLISCLLSFSSVLCSLRAPLPGSWNRTCHVATLSMLMERMKKGLGGRVSPTDGSSVETGCLSHNVRPRPSPSRLCMCAQVFVYVCAHVCVCMCTHVHVCECMHIHTCVCACVCVCVRVGAHVLECRELSVCWAGWAVSDLNLRAA